MRANDCGVVDGGFEVLRDGSDCECTFDFKSMHVVFGT